jgi:hypothetical protein
MTPSGSEARSPAQIARAQAWLAAERCRPTPGSSSRSRYYSTSLLLQLRDRRRYRHKSPANSTFANLAPRTFSSRLGASGASRRERCGARRRRGADAPRRAASASRTAGTARRRACAAPSSPRVVSDDPQRESCGEQRLGNLHNRLHINRNGAPLSARESAARRTGRAGPGTVGVPRHSKRAGHRGALAWSKWINLLATRPSSLCASRARRRSSPWRPRTSPRRGPCRRSSRTPRSASRSRTPGSMRS